MKKSLSLVVLMTSFILLNSFAQTSKPRVLVFFKTMGFKHASIPAGIAAIQKLGKANGFDVDTTSDGAPFTDSNLKKYQAVIFNNTTGNVLTDSQQGAFERYIHSGGGYVGIHAAADTEYDWPWYGRLAGAYFESHPAGVHLAKIDVANIIHPATAGLPDHFQRTDEWYNYKAISPHIKVLATIDEKSYEGGKNGPGHPISWYHGFEGGRAFYTGFGHTDESYSEELFLKHLAGGIKYALGIRPQ